MNYLRHVFMALALSLVMPTALAHTHGGGATIPPWHGHDGLGELSIETSAHDPAAQQWFETGLKLLYSFEYDQARFAFHQAQMAEPSFALAYWGEALTHLRFLWYDNNFTQASEVFERMHANTEAKELTPLERDLIAGLAILLDENGRSLPAKNPDSIFMRFKAHMLSVYEQHPTQADVMTFTAMAIMSTRHGLFDTDVNHEAGTIARKGFASNPTHPGLIHMVIHSYEDSFTASQAKGAAEVYDQVAPSALHALHMPTHYYFAEGLWSAVVAQNNKSWGASLQRQKDLNLSDAYLEYHSAAYLVEALLHLQRYDEAYAMIQTVASKTESGARNGDLARMLAVFWVQAPPDSAAYRELLTLTLSPEHTGRERYGEYLFGRAYAFYQLKDRANLTKTQSAYQAQVMKDIAGFHESVQDPVRIMGTSIDVLMADLAGDPRKAIILARQAVNDEVHMHFERHVPKPTHELLADLLLKQQRKDEAYYYYRRTMDYHKNRTLAVMGAHATTPEQSVKAQ